MIDTNYLTSVAQEAIRTTLIQKGSIEVPVVHGDFDDDIEKQQSYEWFIAACKAHLKYLQDEGFVALNNDVYVLRSGDELTAEVESL